MQFKPYPYQEYAINHIIENKQSGLFLDMGLGKTVCTLTAIEQLIYDYCNVGKVLVIAPARVARTTWINEVHKWDHLKHLTIISIDGTPKQRIKKLEQEADVYTISRDLVTWLVKTLKPRWPFDMVVLDELSSFKSPTAQRFRALKKVPYERVTGLTGTPGNLLDLWAQVYLLDKGERLGKTVTGYRNQYFYPGAHNGHIVYEWKARDGSDTEILNGISDICISMKAADYLTLPPLITHEISVELDKQTKALAKELQQHRLIELIGEDEPITAANAGVVSNMLQQIANGALYTQDGYTRIHDAKLDALEDLVEQAGGSPVLVFCEFRHDYDRILERLPQAKKLESDSDIDAWNNKQIPVMLTHPASAGHGLNFQDGGNIVVWFGVDWSLEYYQQANARLYRQGQTKPVHVYHILAKDTIDEDIMIALDGKDIAQEAIKKAVKARL